MRIAIVSPLFPPDTGAPAPYAKLLAQKLSNHQVTLLIFGHLPESVPRTNFICVDKRWSKIRILITAIWRIYQINENTDLVFVNNGPLSELSILISSFFIKTPIVLCISDPIAQSASHHGLYKKIHSTLRSRATDTIEITTRESKYLPYEKLPFSNIDQKAEQEKIEWWNEHIARIENYAK